MGARRANSNVTSERPAGPFAPAQASPLAATRAPAILCQPATGLGRIVLVEAGASVPLEVVFSATRNRLHRHPGLSFAERWTTGRAIQRAAYETTVSRRLFSALAEDGSFALTWQEGGAPTAVPIDVLAELRRGATVVLQAPAEIAEEARRLAAHVVVLSLTTSAEGNKAGLSRMSCLERMTETPLRQRLRAMRESRDPAIDRQSLLVPSAAAAAVEALSAVLIGLIDSTARCHRRINRNEGLTQPSHARD
jgi:ribose 1,5-bisphosphokinase PhnN